MKKQFKGFTLVEIIIAFAIFAVMAIFVATSISAANRSYVDTQAINRKSDNQNIAANSALINNTATDQKMNASIVNIKIGGSGTDVSGTITAGVNINADFFEKDKAAIVAAELVPEASRTDDEKKLIRDKDAPNLKYAKLPS